MEALEKKNIKLHDRCYLLLFMSMQNRQEIEMVYVMAHSLQISSNPFVHW